MPDPGTLIVLPERDEMLARLMAVQSNEHLEQGLYPLLLKHAGEEKYPAGVVLMLSLAFRDYTEGMLPVIYGLLNMRIKDYLGALIDDPGALSEALNTVDEVIEGYSHTATDAYGEIKKLVHSLAAACEAWSLLADDSDEKPILADSPVEWERTEDGAVKITHHIPGKQHTYVSLHPNGNISISLAYDHSLHELSLALGKEASYSGGPSHSEADFPVDFFTRWLQRAIDACTIM